MSGNQFCVPLKIAPSPMNLDAHIRTFITPLYGTKVCFHLTSYIIPWERSRSCYQTTRQSDEP